MAKTSRQNLVFEEADVFTAQKYLRNLAMGRNPLDGSDLPEESVLRDETLIASLDLGADLLEAWLTNGGFNCVQPKRLRPFVLTDTSRKNIEITEESVGIMTIANRISKVVPYDMQTVRYTHMSNWLQYIGALQWEERDGLKRRVATKTGEELGIRTVDRKAVDGSTYRKNLYNAHAQQFLIDNLESILSYASETAVRNAAAKVEHKKETGE